VIVRKVTELDAAPDLVWRHLQTSRLFRYVSWPMMRFAPVGGAPWPETWHRGAIRVWMWQFGFLPMGRQWVDVSETRADGALYALHDNGRGDLIRRWSHHIAVSPAEGGRTRYSDTIDIEAGLLTPLVWAFAGVFFAHRQRRLRALARRGFSY